ncbi:hypothetical protein RhiirA1_460331 [Rhizophagus irregularis]|uniref:BED-type domain-containing protein n=2 Tax=Rhizophagus irregularis TaxID=588596 RepID=A0A2I1EHW1_9GLOM|nr:hypothetical protein RirG_248790 [Rhizophagus irregularis DAOM 197198w]PKC65981.1 hypothetical protein RhiirA1_460331 [Rhizophagus irregularis]GBC28836.1 hypothetical protein GLOIN_2v1871231 [Rhizophagus irregularis DAOM 181602=DAOM 197198]PKK75592.1 hypothetical protein RhiirC2_773439 [Rhizophagus irregularis]PKY21708.1 hypothetical protein RhiirB3_435398 [Rhizophagus irregularis]
MPKVKKPAWEHFDVIGNHENPHPHVRCKYCPKYFRRAVPQRMQTHLDKCEVAPDDAKSQNNTNNIHSDNIEKIVEKVLQILNNSHSFGYNYQQNINGYYGADQFPFISYQ